MITDEAFDGLRVDVDVDATNTALVELDDLRELHKVFDTTYTPTSALELHNSRISFSDYHLCPHPLIRQRGKQFLNVVPDRVSTFPKIAQSAPVSGVGVVKGAQSLKVLRVVCVNNPVDCGPRLIGAHICGRIY